MKKVDAAFSSCSESFCGITSTLASREFRDISARTFQLQDVLRDEGYQRADVEMLDALLACRQHALKEDRMAPGHVGSREHDEIGLVEVFIIARRDVFAERAAVARYRRRHAQARIGVDVGRADEAFHELVGDVVVFGEQLPGDVKGD